MSREAAITCTNDELVLRVPRAKFTDTVVRDGRITPTRTDLGPVKVEPWTPERIARYEQRLGRHMRIGRRLRRLHNWLDTTGGIRLRDNYADGERLPDTEITWRVRIADRLDAIFAVKPPADRTALVASMLVMGQGDHGIAVR